jgi:hypothetical protein
MVVNEVVIDAPIEAVWEAVATEEGRERWVTEPGEPTPEVRVNAAQAPTRIAWWWWQAGETPRHVDLWISAVPGGTRVIAIESAPGLPLPMLAASLAACAIA